MLRTMVAKARPKALLAVMMASALIAMSGSAASGAVNPRTFTLVMTPDSVGLGTSDSFGATYTNTGTISIGSVDLRAPDNVVITGASSTLGIPTFAGQFVSLRNISLEPSGSLTLTVDATVRCNAHPSLEWTPRARQNGDFTGPSFTFTAAGSDKTVLATGSCSLAFLSQPADALPKAHITDTAFDTSGGPVQVEVLDASASLATGVTGQITMAIGTNPSGGTLKGQRKQPITGGIASFANLSIDLAGEGYTLVASTVGPAPVTSDPFDIASTADVEQCQPSDPCSGSVSDTSGTSATIDAPPGSDGVLTMSLAPGGIDCAGYAEHSSTLTFDFTSSDALVSNLASDETSDSSKQVAMSFDMGDSEFNLNDLQVCFESPTPFTDRSGETDVTIGLLPDCQTQSGERPPPCLLGRTADGSNVTLTFLAPAGDPKGRI